MAIEQTSGDDPDAPLREWRQGDFAFEVGGFLHAVAASGGKKFGGKVITTGVVGMVAISQTCEIVRRTGERHYVTVCPLVRLPSDELKAARKGYKPYLTEVPGAGDDAFADLNRVMSVHKDLLRTWQRGEGFPAESGRVRFSAALERKFGQFAFPDDFDKAVESFKRRVLSRHDKTGSKEGKIYRALLQIRMLAEPDWQAADREITIIAIMKPEEAWEEGVTREKIGEELKARVENVTWSEGFRWSEQQLELAFPAELDGAKILDSQRADFDFLCY